LKDLLDMHGFEVIKALGGEVDYLPSYMRLGDKVFAVVASLASDLIVIARKRS